MTPQYVEIDLSLTHKDGIFYAPATESEFLLPSPLPATASRDLLFVIILGSIAGATKGVQDLSAEQMILRPLWP
jgi:hypothetical protein